MKRIAYLGLKAAVHTDNKRVVCKRQDISLQEDLF